MRLLDAYRGPAWTVDRLTLVASYLGEGPRGRPRHETVEEFPLARVVRDDQAHAAVPNHHKRRGLPGDRCAIPTRREIPVRQRGSALGCDGVKIAVAKEARDGESRVAMVPELVGKLTGLGYDVAVEPGAGRTR